jgi:uncharacterized protein YndB with AHSA1/START domain
MAEVRLEQSFPHPRERLWRALTEPELLSGWFMPTDLRAVPGSRFTIFAGTFPGFLGPVSGEVRQVVPRERLVTVWEGEKLHTRMVWELTSTEQGCRLQVVQSGFFGAPAELRARALRATYQELFTERLPALLDRLAAGRARRWAPPPASTRRPPYRNTAAAIWERGRRLGPTSRPSTPPRSSAVQWGMIRPAVPVRSLIDPPASAAAPRRPGRRADRSHRPRNRSESTGWVRTAASTSAAALIVAVVLAALAYQPQGRPGYPDGSAGSTYWDGPAMAIQPPRSTPTPSPAAVQSPTEDAASRPSSGSERLDQRRPEQSAGAEPAAPAGDSGDRPPAGDSDDRFVPEGESTTGPARLGETGTSPSGTPESTQVPASPSVMPLIADLTSTGLPLLGGRQVTVSVANPGPTEVEDWEVVLDVGKQAVVDVTGANYRREGNRVYLIPSEPLAAGEEQRVQFRIVAPVLGLLGATDPLTCTINGRPCQ